MNRFYNIIFVRYAVVKSSAAEGVEIFGTNVDIRVESEILGPGGLNPFVLCVRKHTIYPAFRPSHQLRLTHQESRGSRPKTC